MLRQSLFFIFLFLVVLTLILRTAALLDILNRILHLFRIQFQAGTGLINQINCLIRQETHRQITLRQFNGSVNSFIGNLNLMIVFITFLQALDNLNRIFFRRLIHSNRHETTFQSGIIAEIFTILDGSCRTDNLNIATSQKRFQNIADTRSIFLITFTGQQCMDFINKDDNLLIVAGFL